MNVDTFIEHNDVYRIIIYDFESGNPIENKLNNRQYSDIKKQLNKIHKLGFVHVDLKLDNILIDKNYKIKLIDFGRTYRDYNIELNIDTEKYLSMGYILNDIEDSYITIEIEKDDLENLRK